MGNRIALLIGVTEYGEGFAPIASPEENVAIMGKVFGDPDIGDFKVTSLINPNLMKMRLAIEDHFDSCQREDLVLFYFSGHGYKNIDRSLYFLSSDSRKKSSGQLKIASALEASFIHRVVMNCMAEQQVFILDCSFSGVFGFEVQKEFNTTGRVVLTSSKSIEFS